MTHRVMAFVDGENIVTRYQDMVAAGYAPHEDVIHEPDTIVWHPKVTTECLCDFTRITYYQTVVGDELKLDSVRQRIRDISYPYITSFGEPADQMASGVLVPRLFKKEKRSAKTKSVDINLTIDMLRHAAQPQFDVLFLFSGDGDYVPLVEEVSRSGKQVWLAAFSKGISPVLKFAVDEFFDLDHIFFKLPSRATKQLSGPVRLRKRKGAAA